MVGIYILFIYTSELVIVGLITLALAPTLRLTFVNLIFFVIGASLGGFAVGNVYILGMTLLVEAFRISNPWPILSGLAWLVGTLGVICGGAASVWLKMRVQKARERI